MAAFPLLPFLAVCSLLALPASAQLVRTVNGSLVMQIAGASLTLSNDGAASNAIALGMAVEASLGSSIADERIRASLVESSLALSVSAELQRATVAEWNITGAVNAEVARAKLAESGEQNRAMMAENSLSQVLGGEITRAINADQSLGVGLASEISRATFATNAEQTRAQNSEGSLAISISAETTRATNAEGSLTIGLNVERSRAISTENLLSAAIVQSQSQANNLSATQLGFSQAQFALQQTQVTLSSTQAALLQNQTALAQALASLQQTQAAFNLSQTALSQSQAALLQVQTSFNSTVSLLQSSTSTAISSLTNQLAAVVNCSQQGLMLGPTGRCISAAQASPSSTSTCGPTNTSTIATLAAPCPAGFSPTAYSVSTCSGTSYSCTAVPCPSSVSSGVSVPTGCRCNPGLAGGVTPSTTTPFFTSTCGFGPSCASLVQTNPGLSSGVYTLAIPSFNGGASFQVYCDFSLDGGIGYAVVFNRLFNGLQQGPSPTEMGQISGTAGFQNDYRVNPLGIFAPYGATRMIVYATIGQSSAGGVASGSTYRAVRINLAPGDMANCFNGVSTVAFVSSASWVAFPSNSTGTAANILGAHGTSGGVYQWTQGANNANSFLLFEYSPSGGTDPNHYWSVYDGTVAPTANMYYRASPLYFNNGAGGALINRYGGVAIF